MVNLQSLIQFKSTDMDTIWIWDIDAIWNSLSPGAAAGGVDLWKTNNLVIINLKLHKNEIRFINAKLNSINELLEISV